MGKKIAIILLLNLIIGALIVWNGYILKDSPSTEGAPLFIPWSLMLFGLGLVLCAAGMATSKKKMAISAALFISILMLIETVIVIISFGKFDWLDQAVIFVILISANAYSKRYA